MLSLTRDLHPSPGADDHVLRVALAGKDEETEGANRGVYFVASCKYDIRIPMSPLQILSWKAVVDGRAPLREESANLL